MKKTSINFTEEDFYNIEQIKKYLKLYKCKASTTTIIRSLLKQEVLLITDRTSKGLHIIVEEIESNKMD